MVTPTQALLCAVCFVWSASALVDCDDVTCDSDQTCSPYDGKCYDRLIYYADFSVYYASTYTGTSGWTDDGTNVSALFDNDNSTSFSLTKNVNRVFNITFIADYYIHAVELLAQTDTLQYGYMWNDGFAQLGSVNWNAFNDISPDDLGNGYKRWILKHTNTSSSSVLDDNETLPFRSEYLYFMLKSTAAMELQALNIYGIGETEAPTTEPTSVPTSPTASPTSSPTPEPTDNPTNDPTEFPTPDVCTAFYDITQPCCGHFNHSVEDIKTNIRNSTLNTCFYSFTSSCCGTVGGYDYDSTSVNCGTDGTNGGDSYVVDNLNSTELDLVLCNINDFNLSLNTSDDIMGTMIYGTNYNLSDDFSTCNCMYVAYECEGVDEATCEGEDMCDDLFDEDCWDGDGDGMFTTTMNLGCSSNDSFANDTCFLESVADNWAYASLLWEPCSLDSFIGDVTAVTYVGNESLDYTGDTCSCTYAALDCYWLSDPAADDKTTTCSDSDCESGICYTQLVLPCCGSNDTQNINNSFNLVTPTYDSYGYPVNDSWTCNNGAASLCPDVKDGLRNYYANSSVGWFYNGTADDIVTQCTCWYFFDQCNLPTTEPTAVPTNEPTQWPTRDPTKDPTIDPTARPTEIQSADSGDGAYSLALYVSMTMIVISFASVFVV